nr:translation initiation factor IF-2-like [Equus asinus]
MFPVSSRRDAEVRPRTRARRPAQPRSEDQRRTPKAAARKAQPGQGVRRSLSGTLLTPLKYTRAFKLSKNSNRGSSKATPSTQARELPCGAWPASPGVLHIPPGAGYSVRFAHRVSAPAEEPARAPDVHVTAHALLPARSPPRKRKRRREQHLPRPSPNNRRPNGPGAATRPLGPAPGAEAAVFPGPSNREKPTEASRIKKGTAGGRHPNSLSLAHEAFVKTVNPVPAGFLHCARHRFPWAPRRPRPGRAQPHPHGAPQPPRLRKPVK